MRVRQITQRVDRLRRRNAVAHRTELCDHGATPHRLHALLCGVVVLGCTRHQARQQHRSIHRQWMSRPKTRGADVRSEELNIPRQPRQPRQPRTKRVLALSDVLGIAVSVLIDAVQVECHRLSGKRAWGRVSTRGARAGKTRQHNDTHLSLSCAPPGPVLKSKGWFR